jgi:hypothetical protein
LNTCPSDYYVVVSQPGVHSTDFSTRKSAPRLGAKMLGKDKSIRSHMSVNEVAGLLDAKQIKNFLVDNCKAQTTAIDGSCELPSWLILGMAGTTLELSLTRMQSRILSRIFRVGPSSYRYRVPHAFSGF